MQQLQESCWNTVTMKRFLGLGGKELNTCWMFHKYLVTHHLNDKQLRILERLQKWKCQPFPWHYDSQQSYLCHDGLLSANYVTNCKNCLRKSIPMRLGSDQNTSWSVGLTLCIVTSRKSACPHVISRWLVNQFQCWTTIAKRTSCIPNVYYNYSTCTKSSSHGFVYVVAFPFLTFHLHTISKWR